MNFVEKINSARHYKQDVILVISMVVVSLLILSFFTISSMLIVSNINHSHSGQDYFYGNFSAVYDCGRNLLYHI